MGRRRKLGDQKCPMADCVGYGKLGRFRLHSRRKSKNVENVRVSKHSTFVHNDRNIREHYISTEFAKKNESDRVNSNPSRFGQSLCKGREVIEQFESVLKGIQRNILKTRIDPKDDIILSSLVREGLKDYVLMFYLPLMYYELLSKVRKTKKDLELMALLQGFFDYVKRFNKSTSIMNDLYKQRRQIDLTAPKIKRLIRNNLPIVLDFLDDPFFRGMKYWFQKYEVPRRREKFDKRNEKLRDIRKKMWHGPSYSGSNANYDKLESRSY